MTTIEFAVTFCCEELMHNMISREYWYEIDIETGHVDIYSRHFNTSTDRCPFCKREPNDTCDVALNKSYFKEQ